MRIRPAIFGVVVALGAAISLAGPVHASSDGYPWVSRAEAQAASWSSVTYGDGKFVAVASTGTHVMTSPDGVTWTSRTAPADIYWRAVAFGGGTFVAVASSGSGNRVMTSPDGVTWTSRSSASDSEWVAVTYGGGLFVATATGGQVMTSPDGVTWTAQTVAAAIHWGDVAYGNGTFVAVSPTVGTQGVMTSPDGVTWTRRSTPDSAGWGALTYGNGKFVLMAKDSGGYILTSLDGITWTRVASSGNAWSSVTYGNGVFVAVASSGSAQVITSPTAAPGSWTERTAAAAVQWTSVAYAEGVFVAVAQTGTGNQVMTSGTYSPQAVTWAPTNTSVLVTASPLTPNASASRTPADGGGISYAVTSAGTTGCSVNASTGELSFTGAGSCTVTATAAEVPEAYSAASTSVTFTVTAASSSPPASGGSGGASSSTGPESSSGSLNEIRRVIPSAVGAPGSLIALAGWGLSTTRAVTFNDIAANFSVVNDGHVEVVVPDVPAGMYVIHAQLAPAVGRASFWEGFRVERADVASASAASAGSAEASPTQVAMPFRKGVIPGPPRDRSLAGRLVIEGTQGATPAVSRFVRTPGVSLERAPEISVENGRAASLRVSRLAGGVSVSAAIRVGSRWFDLGQATTSTTGQLTLPAITSRKAGEYPIRIVRDVGQPVYVTLTVS